MESTCKLMHYNISLDTQVTNCSLCQLRDCLCVIYHWVTENRLKLNAGGRTTLKAVCLFYLVSMPGEVKDPAAKWKKPVVD